MAQEYGFFNYDETTLSEEGIYDRSYNAEQFAEYFALFIGNGVFANPINQLRVESAIGADTPYNVVVRAGWAFINGYWFHLTEDYTITIPANTSANSVYQQIICELDKAKRTVSLITRQTTTAGQTPIRNAQKHGILLGSVMVRSNAPTLQVEDITDYRPDEDLCGFVAGAINQIDASEMFSQLEEQFNYWFDNLKDNLSDDSATNLQNQIGNLSSLKTTKKTDLVTAINEVFGKVAADVLLDLIHPVGSVYMSIEATDPGTLFGGTWVALASEFGTEDSELFLNAINPDNELGIQAGAISGSTQHSHKYGVRQHSYYGVISGGTEDNNMISLDNYSESNTVSETIGSHLGNIENQIGNNVLAQGTKTITASYMRHTAQTEYVDNKPRNYRVYAWRRTA